MVRSIAQSPRAAKALELVEGLQGRLAGELEEVARERGVEQAFAAVDWLRDAGRHGGGMRRSWEHADIFDAASVNVSQVHYDDLPERQLASATALSTIVHPRHPLSPSMHMHISWTELKHGSGYWRMMADLNPAVAFEEDTRDFEAALRTASGDLYEPAREQGDRYFHIPALGRHRGISHFYLEGHDSGDFAADRDFAQRLGESVIDTYARLTRRGLARDASSDDANAQLDYHTLYLFQVLTLDRGTTSGLLIHDENDLGILASLPSAVDRDRLASFGKAMPAPQDRLLARIVDCLEEGHPSPVDDAAKLRFTAALRAHYREHPEALQLQARADRLPPTVANHARRD